MTYTRVQVERLRPGDHIFGLPRDRVVLAVKPYQPGRGPYLGNRAIKATRLLTDRGVEDHPAGGLVLCSTADLSRPSLLLDTKATGTRAYNRLRLAAYKAGLEAEIERARRLQARPAGWPQALPQAAEAEPVEVETGNG